MKIEKSKPKKGVSDLVSCVSDCGGGPLELRTCTRCGVFPDLCVLPASSDHCLHGSFICEYPCFCLLACEIMPSQLGVDWCILNAGVQLLRAIV